MCTDGLPAMQQRHVQARTMRNLGGCWKALSAPWKALGNHFLNVASSTGGILGAIGGSGMASFGSSSPPDSKNATAWSVAHRAGACAPIRVGEGAPTLQTQNRCRQQYRRAYLSSRVTSLPGRFRCHRPWRRPAEVAQRARRTAEQRCRATVAAAARACLYLLKLFHRQPHDCCDSATAVLCRPLGARGAWSAQNPPPSEVSTTASLIA